MPARPPPFSAAIFPVTRLFVDLIHWSASGVDDIQATSWFRRPDENARVGGDPYSQHLVGWAIDVVGSGQGAIAKRARIAGLVAVQEADHLHIQLLPAGTLRRLSSGF